MSPPIASPLIAAEDEELQDWLYGVMSGRPVPAGDFLKAIVDAATRADWQNYPLLRPVLLQLRDKYPQYSFTARRE